MMKPRFSPPCNRSSVKMEDCFQTMSLFIFIYIFGTQPRPIIVYSIFIYTNNAFIISDKCYYRLCRRVTSVRIKR